MDNFFIYKTGCSDEDLEVPAWIQEAQAESQELRNEYPVLFKKVSSLLYRVDPVGLNFGDNPNEYDTEAGTIISRLPSCKSAEDVLKVVYEEFFRWFGMQTAGTEDKFEVVSKQIWKAWQPQEMK